MNKYDKLIDAISDLDADLVEEHLKLKADMNRINEINKNKKETKARRIITDEWKKWALAAACVCLAVITVFTVLPRLNGITPPTPSGSDIFYNENGELDEKLIFANLSQVVWDTSVTSPEEEKPLGQIYEWNGLRLEEELYNKLTTAGENDLFAVRAIYDGKKLYEINTLYQKMTAEQTVLDQLQANVAKLEKFKAEIEALVTTAPTEAEIKAFYDRCAATDSKAFADKYIVDGKYDSEALEKALSVAYKNISNQEKKVAEAKVLANNSVLTTCSSFIRGSGGVLTAHIMDDYVVMFASQNVLKTFGEKVDAKLNRKNAEKDDFIFTLAPEYVADRLNAIYNPPVEEVNPDPNEKTRFAFSKLRFYSTEQEFTTNVDVINEINRCYDYHDDLTFTVTYSGNLPAEKLQAMKYSDISYSDGGDTVTITVNYEDFDIEAMKALSCDGSVWRIYVAYPENAETGFAKNKIYFGWPAYDWDKIYDPVTGTSSGEELVNDRETILKKIDILMGYDHPKSDDILVAFGVKGTDMDRFETVLKRGINLDYYSMNYDSNFKTMVLHIKREGLNIDEFVKAIQDLSYDKEVGKILVSLPMIKSSE